MAYWIRGRGRNGKRASLMSRAATEDAARADARARGVEPETIESIAGVEAPRPPSRYEWGGVVLFALGLVPIGMALFGVATGFAPGKTRSIAEHVDPTGFWLIVSTLGGFGVWLCYSGVRVFLRADPPPPDP